MSASNSTTTTKRRRIDSQPNHAIKSATLILKTLRTPLKSSSTNSHINSIRLTPTNPNCTIGRCKRHCQLVLSDSDKRRRFVSKRHCQIRLDAVKGHLCVVDGFGEIRASLNGVFVNGVRVRVGEEVVLSEGDVIGVGCCELGFGVERIVVERERSDDHCVVNRAKRLLRLCRSVLDSADPVSRIRELRIGSGALNYANDDHVDVGVEYDEGLDVRKCVVVEKEGYLGNVEAIQGEVNLPAEREGRGLISKIVDDTGGGISRPPPGKRFYLNNLQQVNLDSTSDHVSVSLPELLHPVESLSRVFIATFTSDISCMTKGIDRFLGSCKIPVHLPVTIACHNTERCWSAKPDSRFSSPFPDFPKLIVVYPPFPEAIAFGADRTKRGVACHHPKILLLLREQSVRVIITSANLNEKQWNCVTNTVWWQDFPRATAPDYLSLFSSLPDISQVFQSDFAAQLARLISILVTDVPSQAYWVTQLANYDFHSAEGYLVLSIPGFHSHAPPSIPESKLSLFAAHVTPSLESGYLAYVEAFVVGLSHLFCSKTDANGLQLKKLALFFANCRTTAYGMLDVVLRRNKTVSADANAVSVFVPNQDNITEGDYVQLGFLPRDVAKWVSPLWDAELFNFSGYVYPREAIEVALGKTSGKKVRLLLHVSQGPKFSTVSSIMQAEHAVALCSLLASVPRCSGLWRLQEVIGRYSWPEPLETDFVYGSSSIGSSVSPQFLATFSAAIGKRALNYQDSEESDPEWGRWSTSQESKNPSLKILFPSIERVKNSIGGIMPSKRLLCLPEKTWQKLRPAGIFHDAVPHPELRVGHPMHVKVAMRRFQSNTDASSFGWVYCGSHNFSAAAWGRVMNTTETKRKDSDEMHSSKQYSSGPKLHICNYEVGIVFLFPPPGTKKSMAPISRQDNSNIENIVLPFAMPPPKYKPSDRPATFQALREAMLVELAKHKFHPLPQDELLEEEDMVEEEPGEGVIEGINDVTEEKEDEKAYAEELWSQVDSSLN